MAISYGHVSSTSTVEHIRLASAERYGIRYENSKPLLRRTTSHPCYNRSAPIDVIGALVFAKEQCHEHARAGDSRAVRDRCAQVRRAPRADPACRRGSHPHARAVVELP